MASKMATALAEDCHRLAAGLAHPELSKRALSPLSPHGPVAGWDQLSLFEVQRQIGRELEARSAELLVISRDHELALENQRRAIGLRNAHASRVKAKLGAVRDLMEGIYGTGTSVAVFGSRAALSAAPSMLQQLAKGVSERLTHPWLELPEVAGFELDPLELAREIQEPARALGHALATAADARIEVVSTRTEKQAAMKEAEAIKKRVTRFLRALLELAGIDVRNCR